MPVETEPSAGPSLVREPSIAISSHRTLHSWFTPTHLNLVNPSNPDRKGEWTSRRARKGRYAPKSHHGSVPTFAEATKKHYRGDGLGGVEKAESEVRCLTLRLNEGWGLKPHLIVDVSFWIAIAFTFGSMVWVVNGEPLVDEPCLC